MKKKIAIVRGKYLNQYEMQSFEPLRARYDITAFSSLMPFHETFAFPVVKLLSPMDVGHFPYKMQILNRLYKDAQFLYGLENSLEGFDIAHTAETYFNYTQQCLNAKKKGYVKKVVVTVWENIPFNNEGIKGRKEMKQRVVHEADHFIAVSERAKLALLLEGVEEKKISIIHPGVDIKRFTPARSTNDQQIKKIRLLFVGRLEPQKGIFELLEALKLLLSDKILKGYIIELSMVGSISSPVKKKLLQFQIELGLTNTVIYKQLPYDTILEAYHNADIFVAPSKADVYWQEQWGMVLTEAQAAGLPIVTTMTGSIAENVADVAVLVQPADVLSLVEGIKKLILNKKERFSLGKKARDRAVKVHDIKFTAKKIDEVYKKVL